jgi:hypothetical protein
MSIDIDDFCKEFTDTCSFKENQEGIKTCKWCWYRKRRMTKELIEVSLDCLPDRIIKDGFGICKIATKKAMEAGVEKPFYPVITADNGCCDLYKMSIPAILIKIFRMEKVALVREKSGVNG